MAAAFLKVREEGKINVRLDVKFFTPDVTLNYTVISKTCLWAIPYGNIGLFAMQVQTSSLLGNRADVYCYLNYG